MGELIGLLFIALIVVGLVAWLLMTIIRGVFRGVTKVGAKVGGSVAEFGVLAAEASGHRVKKKTKKKIINTGKKIGGLAGVVGSVLVAGEIADVDGVDTVFDNSAADGGFSPNLGDGIDLDNDGLLEGFDTNNDGIIDTNVDGIKITGLESVDGYTKSDGTQVDGYLRTPADDTTTNNLRTKK